MEVKGEEKRERGESKRVKVKIILKRTRMLFSENMIYSPLQIKTYQFYKDQTRTS